MNLWPTSSLLLLLSSVSACSNLRTPPSPARDTYNHARAAVALDEAEDALERGDPAAARKELDTLDRSLVDDVHAQILAARVLIAENRYSEAEKKIAAAVESGAKGSEIELVRGSLDEARGRWEAAAEDYGRAQIADPDALLPALLRARVWIAAGKPSQAAALLEREIARRPGSFDLLTAAGDACLAAGDPESACRDYRSALAIRPNDRHTRLRLVLALSLSGRDEEAVREGRRFDFAELPMHTLLAIGRSALIVGDPGLAARALRRYVDVEHRDASAWLDLGRADYLLAHWEESFEAVKQCLLLDPGKAPALVLLGHLRNRAGQYRAAMDSYLEAIRLGADASPLAPVMSRIVGLPDRVPSLQTEVVPPPAAPSPPVPAAIPAPQEEQSEASGEDDGSSGEAEHGD